MKLKPLVILVLTFTFVGLGLVFLVQRSSETERVRCEEFCKATRQGSVSAPTGTAGRFVDGSTTPRNAQGYCQCISEETRGVAQ